MFCSVSRAKDHLLFSDSLVFIVNIFLKLSTGNQYQEIKCYNCFQPEILLKIILDDSVSVHGLVGVIKLNTSGNTCTEKTDESC